MTSTASTRIHKGWLLLTDDGTRDNCTDVVPPRSDPGDPLERTPGPWPNRFLTSHRRRQFDMDEATRDAAGDAIAEVKVRLNAVLGMLDRHPDNVLALESCVTILRGTILLLECPVEM